MSEFRSFRAIVRAAHAISSVRSHAHLSKCAGGSGFQTAQEKPLLEQMYTSCSATGSRAGAVVTGAANKAVVYQGETPRAETIVAVLGSVATKSACASHRSAERWRPLLAATIRVFKPNDPETKPVSHCDNET